MTDTQTFDTFYRGTVRRLTRYAFGLTGDAAEAQDLAQEAYARGPWPRFHPKRGQGPYPGHV